MARDSQRRAGGRASHANFIGVERCVADSDAFTSLPQMARALYFDLRRQFNGYNNGDICAADAVLKPYGWSHTSIAKGIKILMEHQLIVKTRQGGIASMSRIPSLYGFTDQPIMANPGKGIKGAQPSIEYRSFKAKPKPTRVRKKSEGTSRERHGTPSEPLKVHPMTPPPPKEHPMNLQVSNEFH